MSEITPTTTTYLVDGMTCAHCVASVTDAIQTLDGVTGVTVDLDTGTVTVVAADQPDDGAVRTAVTEAGYEIRP
ncbi:MAG: heavy-metal-associated domain-containing protein [Acidimicrobiales bacterium]